LFNNQIRSRFFCFFVGTVIQRICHSFRSQKLNNNKKNNNNISIPEQPRDLTPNENPTVSGGPVESIAFNLSTAVGDCKSKDKRQKQQKSNYFSQFR
jgi:hypothetical protein